MLKEVTQASQPASFIQLLTRGSNTIEQCFNAPRIVVFPTSPAAHEVEFPRSQGSVTLFLDRRLLTQLRQNHRHLRYDATLGIVGGVLVDVDVRLDHDPASLELL